ncbi:MAG TPA: hypothetical protein DC054_24150 [Blastocatellia bacterium]|nr:hypothetical protein [Blastocatellia bacterium]
MVRKYERITSSSRRFDALSAVPATEFQELRSLNLLGTRTSPSAPRRQARSVFLDKIISRFTLSADGDVRAPSIRFTKLNALVSVIIQSNDAPGFESGGRRL